MPNPERMLPTLESLHPNVVEANRVVAVEVFRVLQEEVVFGKDMLQPRITTTARRFLNSGIESPGAVL